MTLSEDYASRLHAAADRVARLGPDRRAPHLFLEDKDSLEQDLRAMARQVTFDQVLGSRETASPEPQPLDPRPRVVTDRKGRSVAIERRRRRRS